MNVLNSTLKRYIKLFAFSFFMFFIFEFFFFGFFFFDKNITVMSYVFLFTCFLLRVLAAVWAMTWIYRLNVSKTTILVSLILYGPPAIILSFLTGNTTYLKILALGYFIHPNLNIIWAITTGTLFEITRLIIIIKITQKSLNKFQYSTRSSPLASDNRSLAKEMHHNRILTNAIIFLKRIVYYSF